MNRHVLVLCDTEEEYAQHMTEFLKSHREAPWELYTYTQVEELLEYGREHTIDMLVISENAYDRSVRELMPGKTVLLNESGVVRFEHIRNVNKYQAAEEVYKALLAEYMESVQEPLPRLVQEGGARIVGFFTPVHSSLQTTFALTMGQMLAQKYRTLYLNFEYCAGMPELAADVRTRDLSDLVYFLNTDKERFLLRMQTMVLKKGRMDYIPPVKTGMNLPEIRTEEWLELLERIAGCGEYDYLILDLSESIQGLTEILRRCGRIYTLTRDDRSARAKIAQYERLLEMTENSDLLTKTSRYRLPRFRRIPEEIEMYTKGEMADYVSRVMSEVTM